MPVRGSSFPPRLLSSIRRGPRWTDIFVARKEGHRAMNYLTVRSVGVIIIIMIVKRSRRLPPRVRRESWTRISALQARLALLHVRDQDTLRSNKYKNTFLVVCFADLCIFFKHNEILILARSNNTSQHASHVRIFYVLLRSWRDVFCNQRFGENKSQEGRKEWYFFEVSNAQTTCRVYVQPRLLYLSSIPVDAKGLARSQINKLAIRSSER